MDPEIIVAVINLLPTLCSAIIWPLVIGGLIYLFRSPIKNALASLRNDQQDRQLKSLKFGDYFSLEYDLTPQELTEKAQTAQNQGTHYPSLTKIPPEILQLAGISLEWTIDHYWETTKSMIRLLGAIHDIAPKTADPSAEVIQSLMEKGIVNDLLLKLFYSIDEAIDAIDNEEINIDEQPYFGIRLLSAINDFYQSVNQLLQNDESEEKKE